MSEPTVTTTVSDRFLRHEQIDGFSQAAVSRLKVVVIGAGAIGNEVIKNLVLLGVGQSPTAPINLYDFDRVEKHNLTRSVLLRESDIGQSKATAVAHHARTLDPNAHLAAFDGDIADTLSLDAVAAADVVFGCVDNFEARIRINQLCLLAGTAWINTAIDSRYASVEVFPLNGPSQSPCYECTLPASVYEKMAERRSCGGLLKTALARQIMPTTTLTTSLAAALAVNQALVLTGCDTRAPTPGAATDVPPATRLFTDSLTGITTRSEIPSVSLCACCDALPWRVTPAGSALTGSELRQIIGAEKLSDHPDPTVCLSDALIASAACTHCGAQAATDQLAGRRAAAVPDGVILCSRCGQTSVAIEIRDQFALAELSALIGNRRIPGSWVEIGGKYISLGKPGRENP
ncbi:MAG: ThiF family adenylyltransferase [Burkholderiaceae bacterium]